MRIITWNCKMAFRKKAQAIVSLDPDLLIIQECEEPAKLRFPELTRAPTDIIWQGSNPHKGLGIFSFGGVRMKLLDSYNPAIRTVVPIQIEFGNQSFILLAIWAYNRDDTGYTYIGQVWKAIEEYADLLKHHLVIIAGDFNSNVIWDKPGRRVNHSHVVGRLAEHGIESVYHKFHNQTPGQESHPTFYLYHNELRPYHLDYCFASQSLLGKLRNVEIGTYHDWKHLSDHKPLVVDFEW